MAHKALRLHAQAIGNAGNVIEIGDDLGGVVDGDVVKPVRAQGVQVGRGDVVLVACEFDRMAAQGAVRVGQGSCAPIGGYALDPGVGFGRRGEELLDLGTEVVGVGTSSVDTAQFCRHNCSQHLPLGTAEGRPAVHN